MQTNLEATLAKLVSVPSFYDDSTACKAVIDFISQEIEAAKIFTITRSSDSETNPWIIATTQNTKKPDILFAAHADVVPAPAELFTMRKQEGKFYGRGVYDMKSAIACYLELIKNHSDQLRTLNIGFLFTTDEERNGKTVLDVLAAGLRPKVVFLPDGGDNWHVEKRAKGLYAIELSANGKTAHGSRPWEGENALHILQDALHTLRAHYPYTTPSHSTLSINKIVGGEVINQVADSALAQIDFRSFSVADLENYRRLVAEVAKKHNLNIVEINSGTPCSFDPESSAVQSFLKALRRFTGKDSVDYCDSYGASDARHFALYNIPSIIMQPVGGGRHADDEWILASDLSRYYCFIEQWLFPAINDTKNSPSLETVARTPRYQAS